MPHHFSILAHRGPPWEPYTSREGLELTVPPPPSTMPVIDIHRCLLEERNEHLLLLLSRKQQSDLDSGPMAAILPEGFV